MADSVLEQIALALVAALEGVTAAKGYEADVLRVVRLPKESADAYTPEDRLVILFQDDEEIPDDTPNNLHSFTQPFSVYIFLMPSDGDKTAFDSLVNKWRADVRKALYADVTLGGLATMLEVGPALIGKHDTTGAPCLVLPVRVEYRTRVTDPYSQGE